MSDIELRDARKAYGTVTALDGVSLDVARGETVGLVGRNGAGKTTLFKLLVGHETPDAGTVTVAGRPASAGPAVRERVGYLPEHAGFPPSSTGREVLTFHARVRGVANRDRRVERVLRTVGLADAADRAVDGYSNGMNRRLGLATALVGDPDVLLLDEPTAGLDPAGVAAFHDVVESLSRETEVSVLVSSHVLPEIERLCDRVVVLDDGRVAVEGDVADLRRTAGDTAAVVATVAGDPDAVAATAADLDGVADAAAEPPRVRLSVERDAVFDVLAVLDDAADVVDVEVTEPGLAAVFREAVGASGAAPVTDGGGGRD